MTITAVLKYEYLLTTKLASKGIKRWTNPKYYHVELVIDSVWYSSRTDHGLRSLPLKELNDSYDYYKLAILPSKYAIKHLHRFVEDNKDTGYNWLGIGLSQFIPVTTHNRDKWFCSEVVVKMLQTLGVYESIDMDPNRVSPEDVHQLVKLISTKVE